MALTTITYVNQSSKLIRWPVILQLIMLIDLCLLFVSAHIRMSLQLLKECKDGMIAGFDNYFNRPPLAPTTENLEGKDAKTRAENEKAEKEKYATAEAKKVLAETKIPTNRSELVSMAEYLKSKVKRLLLLQSFDHLDSSDCLILTLPGMFI
jgi:hypothetical protein